MNSPLKHKTNLNSLILPTVIFFSIQLIGTFGYYYIEKFSIIDSFYTTVLAISTVGFGTPHELSDYGKIFTSILILLSFGTIGYYITIISRFVIEGIFTNFYKVRKMEKKISKLHNHVIICGYGRNGKQATIELSEHNQDFVIIDKDEHIIDIIKNETPHQYIHGDATHEDILLLAGIENAKALITTMPSDANNVYVVLTARELNSSIKIISRASEDLSDKKLKRAGATNVIMPDKIGGQRMAKLVTQPDILEFIENIILQSNKEVNLTEISCKDLASCFVNKTISELGIRNKSGANILGLKSKEGFYVFNPNPDTIISKDDQLFVLGTPEQINILKKILSQGE